ncbi:uncharacterized protein BDR25DRAFT_317102 [Lindgomyces ingoldianus]|uniref:Uncharacterized protein n=1 Tax=Lindgomyces ingoldianus TaxID=673940 RepID=A0ACB6QML5_9PLEO|nr:uncharacterized protein BDR25DRAFT_317102 [Lindgomyces ingoldianus]KAF2467360.1 hypothetical protein BDR25DRAFT_317102 [Lindgomyces ingoldianus]
MNRQSSRFQEKCTNIYSHAKITRNLVNEELLRICQVAYAVEIISAPFKNSMAVASLLVSSNSLPASVVQMSHDPSGQLQSGSIGLFDDDDEYYATQARIQRRQERRNRRAHRLARGSRLPPFSWLAKVFGWTSKSKSKSKSTHEASMSANETVVWKRARQSTSQSRLCIPSQSSKEGEETELYEISGAYSRPPSPSIFLEECEVVRVRLNKQSGWEIAPKSMIHPRKSREEEIESLLSSVSDEDAAG